MHFQRFKKLFGEFGFYLDDCVLGLTHDTFDSSNGKPFFPDGDVVDLGAAPSGCSTVTSHP